MKMSNKIMSVALMLAFASSSIMAIPPKGTKKAVAPKEAKKSVSESSKLLSELNTGRVPLFKTTPLKIGGAILKDVVQVGKVAAELLLLAALKEDEDFMKALKAVQKEAIEKATKGMEPKKAAQYKSYVYNNFMVQTQKAIKYVITIVESGITIVDDTVHAVINPEKTIKVKGKEQNVLQRIEFPMIMTKEFFNGLEIVSSALAQKQLTPVDVEQGEEKEKEAEAKETPKTEEPTEPGESALIKPSEPEVSAD